MAEGKKDRNDSMGRLLMVLVVVLLMVSMVSTYLIFTLSSVAPTANPAEGSGEVRLTILPRSSQPPEISGGVVSLDILPAG
jgi:flagellar basal body-associated protein FliL